MAEQNWRQALLFSRGDMFGYFLSRPVSIVLAVLVLIGFFSPITMKLFNRKATGKTDIQAEED